MSVIITVFAPEGIVLAADSRLTVTWKSQIDNHENINASQISDTTNKVFLVNEKIGLATCGDADVFGVPIAGYIGQFIDQKIGSGTEVDEVPQLLVDYFSNLKADLNTYFYVVGYKRESEALVQHIWGVGIRDKEIVRTNVNADGTFYGANWNGEIEIISRLVNNVKFPMNGTWNEVPAAQVPWNFLTMQDAIDFAAFAVKTTIDSFRFQQRIKTVGGPVDVLVVQPGITPFWIAKKELHP